MESTGPGRSRSDPSRADLASLMLSLCIVVGEVGAGLLMWGSKAGRAAPIRTAAIAAIALAILALLALSWGQARKRGRSMRRAVRRSVRDTVDVVVELLPR